MRSATLLLSPLLVLSLAVSCGKKDTPSPESKGLGGNGQQGEPSTPIQNPMVGDGQGSAVAKCDYPNVASEEVRLALNAANGSQVADVGTLFEATLKELENQRTRFDDALIEILQLDAAGAPKDDGSSLTSLTWDPSHDAAIFSGRPGKNTPLLVSTHSNGGELRGEALVTLGEEASGRYMTFASNPFRTQLADDPSTMNEQMATLLNRSLRWLTGMGTSDAPHVVLAHLEEGYWFPEESTTRSYLDEHYGGKATYNEEDACDGEQLSECLDGADLLIISVDFAQDTHDPELIALTMQEALKAGTPVLYFHTNGDQNDLGRELQQTLSVQYMRDNYWEEQRAADFDGSSLIGALSGEIESIATVVEHLHLNDFSFDAADIASDPASSDTYTEEFEAGAAGVKTLLRGRDAAGAPLFADCDSVLEKLLVLLGDRLREDIAYPMSAAETDTNTFLRAQFADSAQYLLRPAGPAQPDRGNFDPKDLSQVQGSEVSVSLTSRRNFRSAGVYALPGVPVVVTRKDQSAATTKIFVNSILDRATKPWGDGETSYPRPQFLQSTHLTIAPGASLTFTHPYGGPIQIEFEENDFEVSFDFENVGQHAHWASPEDDESFANVLAAGTYNWVEVVADGFELHSRLDKYEGTIEDERFDTPAKLAEGMNSYAFSSLHLLAGFEGDFIETHEEINGWAESAGFSLRVMDWVKHGNMDQPGCGAGCSGNPYDASWSFSPIGHGDLHELGHQLEKSRFQLSHDGQMYGVHAVTNWWAFYGADRYFADHGGPGGSWGIEHDHIFAELQAAHQTGERAGDFSTHMNSYLGAEIAGGDIKNNYALYLQAMLMARHHEALANAYHVIARLQIMDEEFRGAIADDATWQAAKDSLGFSEFSFEEATGISNNDFIAIAFCFTTGLDYGDYFAMWGVELSATAKAQIASFAYPVVERAFFALDPTDHTRGALSQRHSEFQKLSIDGSTVWPL